MFVNKINCSCNFNIIKCLFTLFLSLLACVCHANAYVENTKSLSSTVLSGHYFNSLLNFGQLDNFPHTEKSPAHKSNASDLDVEQPVTSKTGINFSNFISSVSGYLICAIFILAFLLPKVSVRKELPLLMLLSRWLRWFIFAGVFAYLIKYLEISSRPDWVHFVTGLLLWFLCETCYNWVAIKILSRSDIPLFPGFRINENGDEVLASKSKEWLQKKKFKRSCSLKAQLFEDIFISVSLYESADQTTRIQVSSIPKLSGNATKFYTIVTHGKGNLRCVTDNHSLPFGGFYPKAWYLLRKPLVGSLERLLSLHEKRLAKVNFEQAPYVSKPLDELNNQQKVLEKLNVESGFLNQGEYEEEDGKLSYDGRYRLWKEMWLLAYFGKPISYDTFNCGRSALGQSIW